MIPALTLSLHNMKYYYYVKTADKEVTYQDEEVTVPKALIEAREAKELMKEEVTKAELITEVTAHTLIRRDDKTLSDVQIKSDTADLIVRWDGVSPWVEVIVGELTGEIPFMGWPQVTKENYVEPEVGDPTKWVEPVDEKIIEEVVEIIK